MRRTYWLLAVMVLALTVSPALATTVTPDNLVVDKDTSNPLTDKNPTYWGAKKGSEKSDFNSQDKKDGMNNANPETEEAWVEALLGKAYNDSTITFVAKEGDSVWECKDAKKLTSYNPNLSWDYALVKFGQYSLVFEDTGNDNLLTFSGLKHGVSHITYFQAAPVPIPGAVWLLGSGLAGLLGLRKKFLA